LARVASRCFNWGSSLTDSTVDGADPRRGAPALAQASKDLIDVKAGFRFVCQPFDHLVGDGSA
jgi:hypothetical protein